MTSIRSNPVCRAISCKTNYYLCVVLLWFRRRLDVARQVKPLFRVLGTMPVLYVVQTFSRGPRRLRFDPRLSSFHLCVRPRFGRSAPEQRRRRKQADKSFRFSCRFPASVSENCVRVLEGEAARSEPTRTYNRRLNAITRSTMAFAALSFDTKGRN